MLVESTFKNIICTGIVNKSLKYIYFMTFGTHPVILPVPADRFSFRSFGYLKHFYLISKLINFKASNAQLIMQTANLEEVGKMNICIFLNGIVLQLFKGAFLTVKVM
jgi:hypothetical protein